MKPEPRKAKKTSERPPHQLSSDRNSRRLYRHVLPLAAVIAFTWIAYSNSFSVPFLLDNDPVILKDDRVHTVTAGHLHRILNQQYWPANLAGLYRPLTTLSFLFNYAILGNGADPGGYHWINFLLHAINIVLVYALGLALFETQVPALVLACLWAVHPVLIESVTNMVGRADLLAAFGVLAALLAHRQALRASGTKRAAWLVALSLAVAAGLFSKESGIVAIAAIVLYDLAFDRAVSWKSRAASYVAFAIPCLGFFALRSHVLASAAYTPIPFVDNPLTGESFWTARLTAVKIIGKQIGLLLWPSLLSYDYSYREIAPDGWRAVAALIALVAAAALALRSWRRNPPLFFAIGLFFAALLPTSNVILLIGSIMAERFLYLASAAFWAGVVWAAWKHLPAGESRYRTLAAWAAAIAALAFAVRTYARNSDWADPQRFWRSGVEAAPGSFRTNLSAATHNVLRAPEDWDYSVNKADLALAILDPLTDLKNAGIAYRQAAVVYRTMGEHLAAAGQAPEPWYRKSLEALLRSERIELAQDHRNAGENARQGRPGLTFVPAAVYLELGRTYIRLSDPQHALAALERGRALEPDPDLLEELASAYRSTGDLRKAAQALVEALAMDSTRGSLMSKIIDLYSAIDPAGCAVTHDAGGAGLNLACPLVRSDICSASRNAIAGYRRHGQEYEAGAIRTTAMQDLGCPANLLE